MQLAQPNPTPSTHSLAPVPALFFSTKLTTFDIIYFLFMCLPSPSTRL